MYPSPIGYRSLRDGAGQRERVKVVQVITTNTKKFSILSIGTISEPIKHEYEHIAELEVSYFDNSLPQNIAVNYC